MTQFFSTQTISRIIAFFVFIFIFQYGFSETKNIDKQINVPQFAGTAKQLLEQIGKNENLIFAYSSEVSLDFDVRFEKKTIRLNEFLDNIFKEKPISYKISGNKVQLFPQNRAKLTQMVRGSIVDTDSKLTMPGVVVSIEGTDPLIATTTDEKGNFKLANVPIGRIYLKTSFVGYDALIIPNIEINSGKEVVLDLSMKESVINLNEVIVKPIRNKGEAVNEMALLSTHSFSVEETKRYTGGMQDPARLASSFAGVACSNGGSDIIVRGNSPKYLQWRLDGIEISSPYHMDDQNASAGALTALNNNLLSTSDFYTGAFSSEYGNVLSSVLDLKLRNGNNEKFEATCGIGLMGTELALEGPFKKGYAGSYLVNYRYSTISLLNTIGILDIPGVVSYQDAIFKVVLPTKNIGTFSFFGLGGLSSLVMKNAILVPTTSIKDANIVKDFDKSNSLSNLGMNHTLSLDANSYIKTSLSYSASGIDDQLFEGITIKNYDHQGHFLNDSFANKIEKFSSKISTSAYRANLIYSNKINARNKIQIGTKFTLHTKIYNQYVYNDLSTSLENVTDFDKNIKTLNNFFSWKHSFNDNVSIVTGLHNMNVLLNQKSTLEPRIAINWKINNTNSIHLGYGKHSTMESVHNYYTKLKLNDGSTKEPNKNLDLLKADHYVIGYEKRITENLVAKVEAYYQYLYNLPVENNDTSYYATINESIDYRYIALVNKGKGENYGLEITVEQFFNNNYYFLLNGSLFDSKYKTLDGVWRNTQYNSNFMANFLFGKEFVKLGRNQNKSLTINSKLFYSGGKRYIPLLRDAQNNISVNPSNNQYWDYAKAYSKRYDNIFQLNVSVSYKINKAKTTHEIFLDLMNVTDSRARIMEYYDATQPNSIGYETQFQFFPNLMYRAYF